jgi:hypothetical protein
LTEKDRSGGSFARCGARFRIIEDNYYFKLGFTAMLIDYIVSHPDFIYPEYVKMKYWGFSKTKNSEIFVSAAPSPSLMGNSPAL